MESANYLTLQWKSQEGKAMQYLEDTLSFLSLKPNINYLKEQYYQMK